MKSSDPLTFWESVFRARMRLGRRFTPPNPGTATWMSSHGVTGNCTIAAAEYGPPVGAGPMIAAEMAVLRSRAVKSGQIRPIQRMPWYLAVMGGILFVTLLHDGVRQLVYAVQNGHPWIGVLLRNLAIVVIAGLFGIFLWGMGLGERRMFERLLADWAERLGGNSGSDVLDDLVAWLEARWAWFLPPNLGASDVLWATGARRGVPVLAVLERVTSTVIFNMAAGAAAGVRRHDVTSGWWTRTSVFIHGVQLRDAAHKDRVRRTLALMGGGVIQAPNGVYLYAVLGFLRLYREKLPTSEIWIDLVDQVIDPNFHGSASAAQELHDELVLLGLAAPQEKPHA